MKQHLRRYLLAAGIFSLALVLRYCVQDSLGRVAPYALFFVAVYLSSRFCGLGPALIVTLGGGSLAVLLQHPLSARNMPTWSLWLAEGMVLSLGLFLCLATHSTQRTKSRIIRSQSELERLFGSMAQGVVYVRRHGEIISANRAALELLDLAAQNSRDWRPFHKLCREDGSELPPAEYPFQRVFQTRQSVHGMILGLVRPWGTRWLSVDGILDASAEDELHHQVILLLSDITPQRQAMQVMEYEKSRLRMAARVGRMFAFEWDAIRNKVERSADCGEILGLGGREAVTDTAEGFFARLHPEDRPRLLQHLQCLTPSSPHYQVTYRVLRPDGTTVLIEENAMGYFDPAGKLVRLIGMSCDVTERRKIQDAVLERERQYRRILETAHEGILILDIAGLATFVNSRMEEILGYSSREMVGLHFLTFIDPRRHPAAEDFFHRRAQGIAEQSEFCLRHRDGQEVWTLLSANAISSTAGVYQGVLCMFTDITARRAAEESMRQAKETAETANRAKDHFLAALSHELRTPLTPVRLSLQMLRQHHGLPQAVEQELAMIAHNIDLEIQIIDDLLDLNRIINGKLALRMRPLSLREVIESAVGICQQDIRNRKLELIWELNPAGDALSGDMARLEQVVWNLLKNAIKFTPSGGRITLRILAPEKGYVRLEVQDNGVGLDPSALERIFMAFEQADQLINRQFGGLGLGLAISKAIVEYHGGRIGAMSAGRGQGALFYVELPHSQQNVLTAPNAPAARVVGAQAMRRKMLLVEDHPDTMRVLTRLLSAAGFEVYSAGSVQEASGILETQRIDLLLSDLGLPDGSGYELMTLARERFGIPGICMSGFGMDQDIEKSRKAGFHAHLIKPISIEALEQAIGEVLSPV